MNIANMFYRNNRSSFDNIIISMKSRTERPCFYIAFIAYS